MILCVVQINMMLANLYRKAGQERSAVTSYKEVLRQCPLALDAIIGRRGSGGGREESGGGQVGVRWGSGGVRWGSLARRVDNCPLTPAQGCCLCR